MVLPIISIAATSQKQLGETMDDEAHLGTMRGVVEMLVTHHSRCQKPGGCAEQEQVTWEVMELP